jgi:hypothetical protein
VNTENNSNTYTNDLIEALTGLDITDNEPHLKLVALNENLDGVEIPQPLVSEKRND